MSSFEEQVNGFNILLVQAVRLLAFPIPTCKEHIDDNGSTEENAIRSCSKVDVKRVFQGREGLQLVFSGPRESTNISEEMELNGNTCFSPHVADIIVYF